MVSLCAWQGLYTNLLESVGPQTRIASLAIKLCLCRQMTEQHCLVHAAVPEFTEVHVFVLGVCIALRVLDTGKHQRRFRICPGQVCYQLQRATTACLNRGTAPRV